MDYHSPVEQLVQGVQILLLNSPHSLGHHCEELHCKQSKQTVWFYASHIAETYCSLGHGKLQGVQAVWLHRPHCVD